MSALDHSAQQTLLAQRRARDDSTGDSRIPHVVFLDDQGKPATAVTILSGVDTSVGALRGKQQQLHPFWLGGPSGGGAAPTTFVQSNQLLPATPRLDALTTAAIAKGDGEWQYVPQCVRDTMLRLMRSQSAEVVGAQAGEHQPPPPPSSSSAGGAKTGTTPRGPARRSAGGGTSQLTTSAKSPRAGASSGATKRPGQTPRSSQSATTTNTSTAAVAAAPPSGVSSRISFIDTEGLSRRRRSSTPQEGVPLSARQHTRGIDGGRDYYRYHEDRDDEDEEGGSVRRKFMSPMVAKVLQRGGGWGGDQPSPRNDAASHMDDEDRRSAARYGSRSPRDDDGSGGGARNAPFGKLESHPYDVEDERQQHGGPQAAVSARLEARMEADEDNDEEGGVVAGRQQQPQRALNRPKSAAVTDPFDDHNDEDQYRHQRQNQQPPLRRGVAPALALQQRLPFGSVLRSPRRVSPTAKSSAASSRSGSAAVPATRRRNEGVGPHASEYDGAEVPGSDDMPLSARLDAAHASRNNPAATVQQVRSLAASNLLTFHFGVDRMRADFERFLEAQLFTAMQCDPRATGGMHRTPRSGQRRSGGLGGGSHDDVLAPSILESEQLQALEDVVAQTKRLHEASVELVSVFLSHEEKRYLGLHSHKFQSRRERATSYQYTSGIRKSPTSIRSAQPQPSQPDGSAEKAQQRPPPPPSPPRRRKAVPVSAAVSLSAITARFGSAVEAEAATSRERLVVSQGVRGGAASAPPPQAGAAAAAAAAPPVSPRRETATPTSPSTLPPPPRLPSRHRTSSPTRVDPPAVPLTRLGSGTSSGGETSPNTSVSARAAAPPVSTTVIGVGSQNIAPQLVSPAVVAADGKKTPTTTAAAAAVDNSAGSTSTTAKRATAAAGQSLPTPNASLTTAQPQPNTQTARPGTAGSDAAMNSSGRRAQPQPAAAAPVSTSSSLPQATAASSSPPRSPVRGSTARTRGAAEEVERSKTQPATSAAQQQQQPSAGVVVATASFAALQPPAPSSRSASSSADAAAGSTPALGIPAALATSGNNNAPSVVAPSFQNRPQPRQPSPAATDPTTAVRSASSSSSVAPQSVSQARSVSAASLHPAQPPSGSTEFLPSQAFASRGHASVGHSHLPPGAVPLWVAPAPTTAAVGLPPPPAATALSSSLSTTNRGGASEFPLQQQLPLSNGASRDPSPSGQSSVGGGGVGKRVINLEHLRVVDSDEDSDDD